MIPLIRHAQELAFEEAEWVKFKEKVVDYLIEHEQGKADNREGVHAFTDEKLEQAKALSLESEIDLLNFTICCRKYGEKVERGMGRIKEELGDHPEDYKSALASFLHTFSKANSLDDDEVNKWTPLTTVLIPDFCKSQFSSWVDGRIFWAF